MQSSEVTAVSGRDDYLDNIKGILMVSVVYVHIYDMMCLKTGWMYGLRLGILTVQMPLFMFLSGYFGKKDEKRREEALREFLLPFLVFNTLYYLMRQWQGEEFEYGLLRPFNMYWYLMALLLFRLLMPSLKRVRGILPLSFLLSLYAGMDQHLGRTLSLSRAIGFLPFYLMGYYCPRDWLARAKRIPKPVALVLLVLCALAAYKLTVYFEPYVKASHPYQLVGGYKVQHLTKKEGMLMRGSLHVLAPIMGACLLSLCMRCRCIFTTIGRHSLTVYLLHAFPMLYMLELFPKKFHATTTAFAILVVYSLVVSRLLASRPVNAAYDAVFGAMKRGLFVREETEKEKR